MVDLGKSDTLDYLKLCTTNGDNPPYATVSYSWGESRRILTRRENLEQRCRNFPLSEFPKILRDAVCIAKSLGFRNVWISSLCIIQGDRLDWAEQGAAMNDIYCFSALNISATSTSNSDEGILRDLPDHGFQLESCWRLDSLEPLLVFVSLPIEILDLEEKFLSTRG